MVGAILEKTDKVGSGANVVVMIQLLALTGCRRGETINFRWEEVDETKGCFRLRDTKEGRSIRPIGCRRGGGEVNLLMRTGLDWADTYEATAKTKLSWWRQIARFVRVLP